MSISQERMLTLTLPLPAYERLCKAIEAAEGSSLEQLARDKPDIAYRYLSRQALAMAEQANRGKFIDAEGREVLSVEQDSAAAFQTILYNHIQGDFDPTAGPIAVSVEVDAPQNTVLAFTVTPPRHRCPDDQTPV